MLAKWNEQVRVQTTMLMIDNGINSVAIAR